MVGRTDAEKERTMSVNPDEYNEDWRDAVEQDDYTDEDMYGDDEFDEDDYRDEDDWDE